MSRRKKKEPIIEVIAYLSTTGPLWETKKREKNQESADVQAAPDEVDSDELIVMNFENNESHK